MDKPILVTKDGRRFRFELSITGVVVDHQPRIPCSQCNGRGVVGGFLDEERECEACFGRGTFPNPHNEPVPPPKEMFEYVEKAMNDFIESRWPKQ